MGGPDYNFHVSRGGLLLAGLAGLVGIAAFNSDINLLFLICATMVSALLVSVLLPMYLMARLDARRGIPREIHANEPFPVSLRVRNPSGRRPRAMTVQDRIQANGHTVRPKTYVEDVPSDQSVSATYLAELPKRGVYACPNLRLTSRFPFGLAAVTRVLPVTGEILVFPERVRLRRSFLATVRRSMSSTGATARRSSGDEEFRSLREFVPGDSPRRIHWRTTARMGKPYLREMERDRERTLLVLMDGCVPPEDPARSEAFERGLSFAVEFVRAAVLAGGVVRFATYGPDLRVVGPLSAPRDFHGLKTAMARMEPTPDRQFGDLVEEPSVQFGAALRRAAIALSPESLHSLRQAAGGAVMDTYLVGSRTFEDAIEPVAPLRAEGVFR